MIFEILFSFYTLLFTKFLNDNISKHSHRIVATVPALEFFWRCPEWVLRWHSCDCWFHPELVHTGQPIGCILKQPIKNRQIISHKLFQKLSAMLLYYHGNLKCESGHSLIIIILYNNIFSRSVRILKHKIICKFSAC